MSIPIMENNLDERKKYGIFPMMEDRKLLLKDVNDFFICKICRGYLIDATALLECTHTCKFFNIKVIAFSPILLLIVIIIIKYNNID